MKLKIKIASRKSKLALCQVDIVKKALGKNVTISVIDILTSGDKILDKSLSEIGGKGLFIKELEHTILDGRADIAVHSMKDMETEIAPNTLIAAVLPRADRSDVLLGNYNTFDELPNGAVIGTSSVRRAAYAKSYRPDLVIPKEIIPPASTQGVIAIQSTTFKNTETEMDINHLLSKINDKNTEYETLAERSFLAFLDGSCRSPISSSAYIKDNNNLTLYGSIAKIDGTEVIKSSITGSVSDAVLLGQELGKEIISKGGNKIL